VRHPCDGRSSANRLGNVNSMLRTRPTGIDGFFKISERGSTLGQEVRGGLVTFFTMAYIIVLNPIILGGAVDENGDFVTGGTEGADIAMIAAATALVAGVLTILMGVVANLSRHLSESGRPIAR
jgi:AGZA family xanthine/uracil permease-like MFS transporter